MTRNRLGFVWTGALAGLLASFACGKTAGEHGGESHFQCEGDDDCHGPGQVCVRAEPSDETGECKPASEAPGTGGASSGGDTSSGGTASGGTASGGTASGGTASGGTASGGGASGGNGPGANPGGTTASGGGPVVLGRCNGSCCPIEDSCYATESGAGSGRECAAFHDNTGQSRIQLRQTSTHAELPLGLTIPIIQRARNDYSLFPRSAQNGAACFTQNASSAGRFIQLLDIPLTGALEHTATSGFSGFVAPQAAENILAEGLCMVGGVFAGDEAYRLGAGQMSNSSAYPVGLPPPRGLADSPWPISQVSYTRSEADFNLATDREALLARGSGTFFYDESAGYYHSFAPIAYSVQYGSFATSPPPASTVIPAREIETRIFFNDPAHPNCAGGILPGDTGCGGDGLTWGGLECDNAGNCTPSSGAASRHEGYMLITELEQVYEPQLFTTLCVVVMTKAEAEASGWLSADGKSCKSERWDPAAPNDAGLPFGDWCAATNSPATATCHDAFRIRERTTFAATKVQLDHNSVPEQCPM